MGISASPIICDLYLFSYQHKHFKRTLDKVYAGEEKEKVLLQCLFTFRYLDNILCMFKLKERNPINESGGGAYLNYIKFKKFINVKVS